MGEERGVRRGHSAADQEAFGADWDEEGSPGARVCGAQVEGCVESFRAADPGPIEPSTVAMLKVEAANAAGTAAQR